MPHWRAIVIAFLSCSGVRAQSVLYVDAGLTTGANDGSSWHDAFQGSDGLAAALASSPMTGDIYITAGTYIPRRLSTYFAYFQVRRHRLFGGFLGGEATPADRPPVGGAETILTGDLNGDDGPNGSNMDENSLFVVSAFGDGFELDRLTITAGNGRSTPQGGGRGGGLTASGPSGEVRDCRFVRNRAQRGGGASATGRVDFLRCTFDGNIATHAGGGLYFDLARMRVIDCRFLRNTSREGAAIFGSGAYEASLINSVLFDNLSRGPVVQAPYNGGSIVLSRVDDVTLLNCLITGNRSENDLNAGLRYEQTMIEAHNCIVWGNTGAGGYQGAEAQAQAGTPFTHSIVHPGHLGGSGNAAGPPGFVDAASGDFRLSPGSPAIDFGDSTVLPREIVFDADGGERFQDVPSVPNLGVALINGAVADAGPFEVQVGSVGIVRCLSPANSTGARGMLTGWGSNVAARNDLTISAHSLPPSVSSLLLVSDDRERTPSYNGSLGALCLGAPFGRYESRLRTSDTQGRVEFPVDLTSIPAPLGAAIAGEELHFQVWFRDSDTLVPIPTSNFTVSLAVSLR